MPEQCSTCRFFKLSKTTRSDDTYQWGVCRRYAPQYRDSNLRYMEDNLFPPMTGDQWCGDYCKKER